MKQRTTLNYNGLKVSGHVERFEQHAVFDKSGRRHLFDRVTVTMNISPTRPRKRR